MYVITPSRPGSLARGLTLLAFATALALPATTRAVNAPITWGSATVVSGDSDVVTTGTLVGAFNVGAPGVSATTVNGVTFAPFAVAVPSGPPGSTTAVGKFNLLFTGVSSATNTGFGSGSAPYASLSGAYQTLLSAGVFNYSTNSMNLSFSGLTIGQNYTFEWWSNNSDQSFLPGPEQATIATATNSARLFDNVGFTPGSMGQYAIGTFTASDVSESISLTSDPLSIPGVPVLNAFQLRTAAPEPGSAALLAIGVGALLGRRGRRHA